MKYTIINIEELSNVDFNVVLETSKHTLRFNNSNTQFVLKFDGETPSFLQDKTLYNYQEIMQILNSPEWTQHTD